MMGEDRSDPRPMLGLFALLMAAAIWRAVSSIRLDQLLASAASLAPIALGALAIASALATQRFLATRRTLATRTAAAIVPADEFDAKPEAVLRIAAELARADRSVRGWFDRRACALRVRLTNDGEGRLVYLLEVPARSRQLLRNALRGYEGVELRDAAEVAPEPDRPGEVTLRTELTLARPSVEPLARLDNEPDPLQPFAAAMASLRPRRGERSTVCLDLLPAAGRRRIRLRRRLKRQARRAHGERRSLMEVLDGERRRDTANPAELIDRRLVGQALDAKLRDAGPLFEAQILLRAQATERPRAKLAMQSLLAAFEPFAAQNWLRPAGLGIGDAVFFGSDFPTRKRGFDRRLSSGLFRPARRSILTAREVAGFLKPPTVHCVAENVLRSGTLLPAPPKLPTFEKTKDALIPLGRIAGEGGERVVGVRTADTFFSYVAGRSRYGKTETAITQFVHLVRSGHGGLFLDPHADALERIRPYLNDPDLIGRVVEIDLSSTRLQSLPGWNLFELTGSGSAAAESRVEAIVDAFASTLQWGEQSTRAINLTTQAAGALARIAPVLPPELAPTIFQLPTLLSNELARRRPPVPAQGFAGVLDRPLPAARSGGDHPCDQPGRPPASLDADQRPARSEPEHLPGARGDGQRGDRPRLPRLGRHPRAPARQPAPLRLAARGAHEVRACSRCPPSFLGLPRRGPELRRRGLGQPRRAAGAERQVRAPRGRAEPEPRATEPADVERAHHQPLAPARDRAELARRRPAHQGVGGPARPGPR